jgi:3-hydroxyacyl-[acyl-carrier-protein] dehydratase
MKALLESVDIQRLLPHRYPILLVDRVVEIEPGKRIVAVKNVSGNEPFFQGHFPGFPVMPGVLIIEAMAQAGGLLALHGNRLAEGEFMLFAGIDKVRFRRAVLPGDTLVITVEALRLRARSAHLRGTATVDGALAAEAEILSMMGQQPPSDAADRWSAPKAKTESE